MASVFSATGTGWTRTVRRRKHYTITARLSGSGRCKSIHFTLLRDGPAGQEQMALSIAGEEQLRALADLIQRTLASEADCVASLTPFEHLGPPPEMEQPPISDRSDNGAAHHLK